MKYIVQYNNGRHACGPVLLLNALKHQGHKVGRRHLPWVARRLKSGGHGVYVKDLKRVARQMGAFRRMNQPSVDKINAALLRGDAVALRIGLDHKRLGNLGHYMMLSAIWCHRGNISYYVCNIGGRCRWMEFDEVDKYWRKFAHDWWVSHFWLVPRKGKRLKLREG